MQDPKGQETNVGKGGWTREMDVEDMDDIESTEHGTFLDTGSRRGQLKIILLKCCYHKSSLCQFFNSLLLFFPVWESSI